MFCFSSTQSSLWKVLVCLVPVFCLFVFWERVCPGLNSCFSFPHLPSAGIMIAIKLILKSCFGSWFSHLTMDSGYQNSARLHSKLLLPLDLSSMSHPAISGVCASVCVYMLKQIPVPVGARALRHPGTWMTDSCGLPEMHAGNQTYTSARATHAHQPQLYFGEHF